MGAPFSHRGSPLHSEWEYDWYQIEVSGRWVHRAMDSAEGLALCFILYIFIPIVLMRGGIFLYKKILCK